MSLFFEVKFAQRLLIFVFLLHNLINFFGFSFFFIFQLWLCLLYLVRAWWHLIHLLTIIGLRWRTLKFNPILFWLNFLNLVIFFIFDLSSINIRALWICLIWFIYLNGIVVACKWGPLRYLIFTLLFWLINFFHFYQTLIVTLLLFFLFWLLFLYSWCIVICTTVICWLNNSLTEHLLWIGWTQSSIGVRLRSCWLDYYWVVKIISGRLRRRCSWFFCKWRFLIIHGCLCRDKRFFVERVSVRFALILTRFGLLLFFRWSFLCLILHF